MKLELNRFIKDAAAGDQSKYTSRRNHTLVNDFYALLGFKRWHTSVMRPDCDPKWDYFRWSIRKHAVVKNIRVMSFRFLYPNCIIEIAKEKDITLPNGWKLADLMETLIQMRREYKAGYIRSFEKMGDYSNCENYKEWQLIAKYLLNSIWHIICSKGSAINLGGHEIIGRAREKVCVAVNEIISSGGVVLHVNVDEIAYYGKQVEFDNVHHEKHRYGIFTGSGGAAWGDNMVISGHIPTIRFDLDEWEHFIDDRRSADDQRAMAERLAATRIKQFTSEIMEYMNRTKEDVLKECIDLSGE